MVCSRLAPRALPRGSVMRRVVQRVTAQLAGSSFSRQLRRRTFLVTRPHMTHAFPGRAPSRPAPGLAFGRIVPALAFALAVPAVGPLAAQSAGGIAPDSAVSIRVATRVVSSAPLSPALAQEVYVAAFRSSARQWCAAGSATGLDDALASTRTIVQRSVADADRPAVENALVAAHAELTRAGGCGALTRPTNRVVVDRFEGFAWNSPRQKVAPRDEGARSEEGYTVVTRRAKLGTRRFHRVSADADFTFTTEREELVRGRYRVSAPADEVTDRWATVESAIAEQYPSLRVVRSGAMRIAGEPGARGSQGDGSATTTDMRRWVTLFVNPDTQALEARMFARPVDKALRDWEIVVDYMGFVGR